MKRNSPPEGLGGFVPDCGPRHLGNVAKQEIDMRSLIQCTEAFELSASISQHGPVGYHLKLIGFIPSANHPEEQVRFQGMFSKTELQALRDFLDAAIKESA